MIVKDKQHSQQHQVKNTNELASLPLSVLQKQLKTSSKGLSHDEANKRISVYGYNEINSKKTNPLLKFLSYFWGPIPWMIEIAIILSGILKHWPDLIIISVLLLANALIGYLEEHSAGKAIDALKAQLAIKAKVLRDSAWITCAARELVPGDVIRIRLGDIVPADVKLLEGDPIECDESALTGESLPVTRKSGSSVYSGSVVRQGEINAVVYATGHHTYFGKTAELVVNTKTVSHFQKSVLQIGRYLILLALALVLIIVITSVIRHESLLSTLQFVLILTIAAIPVAMPTVLSVTMAVGARLLAKKGAIVSRLVAIEELAGVDVLCSDKTGTLTKNELTLGKPFTIEGTSSDDIVLYASLASRKEDNDTIDLAVLNSLKNENLLNEYTVSKFKPFDPVSKRTEAIVKNIHNQAEFKVTKGAPQVILSLCSNANSIKESVNGAVNDFAKRGYRALGVAKSNSHGEWEFLGILPMFDPPREDAKATIRSAKNMGVLIKMVTGDALAIAKEMAKNLGLGNSIVDASSLDRNDLKASTEEVNEIEGADGFAQVFPEHKYRIISLLQKKGHYVGMTGDGVNDAPALKKANCGIAVAGATDAAREAASIILTNPGLSVIIDAVKESRKIVERMNSYAIYRIAETLRVLVFVTLAILVFNFFPVTAIMIVVLALLNDGSILSIAYDNVLESPEPEAWNMKRVIGIASILGLIGPIAAFGLFYIGVHYLHLNHAHLQTMMYLMLSVAGSLTIFLTRTRGPFWSIKPKRILLFAVLGAETVATLLSGFGILMTPLSWSLVAFVWGYALIWFLITDRVKLLGYLVIDRKTKKTPHTKNVLAHVASIN